MKKAALKIFTLGIIVYIVFVYAYPKVAFDFIARYQDEYKGISVIQTANSTISYAKVTSKVKVVLTEKIHSRPKNVSNPKIVLKKQKPKVKYLIYLCDSRRNCGGLGDRERGITYAFMAAIQFDRKFGIIMSTPCELQQFYIPNKYNWMIPETDLIGKSQKIIDAMGKGGVNLINDTTEVIFLRTNSPSNGYVYRRIRKKLPPYLKGGTTRSHIFQLIWNSLMKPSHHVLNHLKTLPLSQNITCAHIRIGKSKNLKNDSPRNNIENVPIVWDFMEQFDTNNAIFVASDNIEVRKSAQERFGKRFFDTGGKIVHIDRQKWANDVCVGFETAIIDQLILSNCSVLIISMSQFSVRAAMLRNKAENLYGFHGTNVKPYKLT